MSSPRSRSSSIKRKKGQSLFPYTAVYSSVWTQGLGKPLQGRTGSPCYLHQNHSSAAPSESTSYRGFPLNTGLPRHATLYFILLIFDCVRVKSAIQRVRTQRRSSLLCTRPFEQHSLCLRSFTLITKPTCSSLAVFLFLN